MVQCCQMSSAVCFGEPVHPDTGWHILLQNAIVIIYISSHDIVELSWHSTALMSLCFIFASENMEVT